MRERARDWRERIENPVRDFLSDFKQGVAEMRAQALDGERSTMEREPKTRWERESFIDRSDDPFTPDRGRERG